MGQSSYVVARFFGKWIYSLSMHGHVVGRTLPEREGGYVLAPTHVSHLEPFLVSCIVKRHVDWMARVEFYRWWFQRVFLDQFNAFPVNRTGVPVSSIRTAINRARAGRVVGIFPEGNVSLDDASVCRGGPIKQGACLVAIRANVPIVPCVILGTHQLTGFYPWLPYRRAKLYFAFGDPIPPVHNAATHKLARHQMADQLCKAYRALYYELRQRYNLPDRAR